MPSQEAVRFVAIIHRALDDAADWHVRKLPGELEDSF